MVEKNIHYLTQRWWRTARVASPTEAQASLDSFCARVADLRPRGDTTVGELADREPLLALPALAYPATVEVTRVVAANALVSVWGNRYSVPPGFVATEVIVRWRLGTDTIDVFSAAGVIVVTHRLAPRGAGRTTTVARTCGRVGEGRARRVQHRSAVSPESEPAAIGRGACPRRRDRRSTRAETRSSTSTPINASSTRTRGASMTRDSIYQQLRAHLAYLNLAAAAEAFPAALDTATKTKQAHTTFLEQPCCASRSTPPKLDATPDGFGSRTSPHHGGSKTSTSPRNPASMKHLIRDLASCRYTDDATNVLFIGPPGVGKTMLAIALGHAAVDAG